MHEHLLKVHIYLHTASGDTPILEYRRLRFNSLEYLSHQGTFKNGVVVV